MTTEYVSSTCPGAGADSTTTHICTLCENDAPELFPWGQCERLCLDCLDLNLDLLALAVAELPPADDQLARAA